MLGWTTGVAATGLADGERGLSRERHGLSGESRTSARTKRGRVPASVRDAIVCGACVDVRGRARVGG
jgi:hypothetical protein